MDLKYQYRGDLAERPLPEMLQTIYQHRVPGVIQAIRDDQVRRAYVRDSAVIHATSSDLQESLGCYLLKTGRISRQDFRSTMRARRDSDHRLGVLLVERGLMAPAELQRTVRLQTASILWGLFTWARGIVTFSIGEFDQPTATLIQIPMRQAIKEGVKRVTNLAPLLQRVGGPNTVLEPTFTTEDLIDAALSQEELDLLRQVDGAKSLADLCDSGGGDRNANGRLLYAFHVLQFVRPRAESTSGSIKIRLKST